MVCNKAPRRMWTSGKETFVQCSNVEHWALNVQVSNWVQRYNVDSIGWYCVYVPYSRCWVLWPMMSTVIIESQWDLMWTHSGCTIHASNTSVDPYLSVLLSCNHKPKSLMLSTLNRWYWNNQSYNSHSIRMEIVLCTIRDSFVVISTPSYQGNCKPGAT